MPVVTVVDVTPAPATVPAGPRPDYEQPGDEQGYSELVGSRIHEDLATIVGFSRQDRADGNRAWGRVTGFPAAERTLEWVAEQLRAAGLENVELQPYEQEGTMWWSRNWGVRLPGDAAFGSGSHDVVLESALPTSGSELPDGVVTAALVDTGSTSDALSLDLEITGKVAVQHLRPTAGAYSERGRTVERARELMARGAVAVLNVVEQTGNMHVRDFSNCNGPCFNLGTADGAFLDEVMARAAEAGLASQIAIRLELDTEQLTGLVGHNVVGILPAEAGRRTGESILVNAHADGWFDAAGDNADGLAVLLALARHFVKPEHRLERDLTFVASGGHHSRGLNGPANFVRMNPELTATAVLALNLEHLAQLLVRSADWQVEATEQPMSWGVDNEAPFLFELARTGIERYGFRLNPEFRAGVPGDLGGYAPLGIPRVQAIHSGPLYHTSGDVLETISVPGLERAARFYAFYLREVAAAPRVLLQPISSSASP